MSETIQEANKISRIEHLTELLKGRREEYQIFGKTSQDAEYDFKIMNEIRELESSLPH